MHRTALWHPDASRSSRSSPKPQSGLPGKKMCWPQQVFHRVLVGEYSPDSPLTNTAEIEQSLQNKVFFCDKAFIFFGNTNKTKSFLNWFSLSWLLNLTQLRYERTRKAPGELSQKLFLNIICVVFLFPWLHAPSHSFLHFVCPSVLQKGAGWFLHWLFVPNWVQHTLCLPGQDTHPGETSSPQHLQPAQVHCFGKWFLHKKVKFLHYIALRSNTRTLPEQPGVFL